MAAVFSFPRVKEAAVRPSDEHKLQTINYALNKSFSKILSGLQPRISPGQDFIEYCRRENCKNSYKSFVT
jgi:hypothetical protein